MVTNLVGPPVRGANCYGRDAFVDLVWQKLDVGHVLLAAPRRFGKTSIMYRLVDEPRGEYQIVHADLEHLPDAAAFITEIAVQLATETRLAKLLHGARSFPAGVWSRFRHNVQEVELVKFKLRLKEEMRSRWQEQGEEIFRRVARAEHPVLFMLDEFPMMIDRMARSEAHREEAKTLLRWLRALRLSPDIGSVRFLIAGSIGIGHVLNELGEITAINDFEQLRLEPFPAPVAAEFLGELSAAHHVPLSDPSRRRILDLLGIIVPNILQVLFSEVAKAYTQDGETVTPKRIEHIYREKVLGVDCKTYFDHYYGRLRDYYRPHEEKAIKRLLRELALQGALSRDSCYHVYAAERGGEGDVEEFNAVMINLENDFYIRFDLAHRRYQFACNLLRDWWLCHYAMEAAA